MAVNTVQISVEKAADAGEFWWLFLLGAIIIIIGFCVFLIKKKREDTDEYRFIKKDFGVKSHLSDKSL